MKYIICNYKVNWKGNTELSIPSLSKIVKVGIVNDDVYIYVMQPASPSVTHTDRIFTLVQSNTALEEFETSYVGTVFSDNYVCHLVEYK